MAVPQNMDGLQNVAGQNTHGRAKYTWQGHHTHAKLP